MKHDEEDKLKKCIVPVRPIDKCTHEVARGNHTRFSLKRLSIQLKVLYKF